MLASSLPASFTKAFAAGASAGYIRVVPDASQISVTPGAASLTDGFPPLNFSPIASGGVPPFGQDMNGILNAITKGLQWIQVGGRPVFDATFQTAIGGYPNGAILQSADGTGYWRSTVDNNLTNPETGGANWQPQSFYGAGLVSLSGSNVTLSLAQYARPILLLTGTLTANVNMILPTIYGQWLVLNNTTGAFTITAKTASGTGVVLTAGVNPIYGDAANINASSVLTPFASNAEAQAFSSTVKAISPSTLANAFKGGNQSLATNGYQTLPGGLILQWKSGANDPANTTETTQTVVLPITFPNAILQAFATTQSAAANPLCDVWYQVYATSTANVSVQRQQSASTSNPTATSPIIFAIGY